jgi:peptidyl-prolyl cis-trans isomerase A (cyclophilin A)
MKTRRVGRIACLAAFALACGGKDAPASEGRAPEESAPQAKAAPAQHKPAPAKAKPQAKPAKPETVDGYQVIRARTKDENEASIGLKAPDGWAIVVPPDSPDPHKGKFTLEQALKGLGGAGKLAARMRTKLGTLYCDLFDKEAPTTVANFVGLARGKRKFWDARQRAWVARPYYDKTPFHRVIPNYMIQGGDYAGTGRGLVGFTIADENQKRKHDQPGQLCMATRGPNTGAAQFFITERPTPELDGSYTVFGQCAPVSVVQRIARVPQVGAPTNRPLNPVVIEEVEIKRVPGGAAKWSPEAATPPPGRAVKLEQNDSPDSAPR